MNGERSHDSEFELGVECKGRGKEEEKKKFQAKRTARVKIQRNKSASKNRILIECGQIIKGIT